MSILAIILAAVLGRPLPREKQEYPVIDEMSEPTPAQQKQWAREDEEHNKRQNDIGAWWSS